jgi:hypothetical protein
MRLRGVVLVSFLITGATLCRETLRSYVCLHFKQAQNGIVDKTSTQT